VQREFLRPAAAETEIVSQDEAIAASFSPQPNGLEMGSLFRQPVGGNAFESTAARERNLEFGEFTGYRGVRVFGAAWPIAAAGASLARKVDKDEALAKFHKRALPPHHFSSATIWALSLRAHR